MRLAKYVFTGAGIWGLVVLTPIYWLFDISGRRYAPPVDYPHFFYGFLSVAMAWQIAFLVIGSNPARFRPLRSHFSPTSGLERCKSDSRSCFAWFA